jgi:hypothetical protein
MRHPGSDAWIAKGGQRMAGPTTEVPFGRELAEPAVYQVPGPSLDEWAKIGLWGKTTETVISGMRLTPNQPS